MPAFLIAIVGRLGVAEPYRKLAVWVIAILAAIALLGGLYGAWRLWLNHYAKAAVSADRATTDVQTLNATIGADRDAGANQVARDALDANQQQRLEKAHDQAVHDGDDAWDAIANEL